MLSAVAVARGRLDPAELQKKRRGSAAFSPVQRKSERRILGENLLALFPDERQQHENQQEGRDEQHAGTYRTGEEDRRIAAGDEQRAAQILFHQRPQHESEQQRRRLASPFDGVIAEEAKSRP